MSRTPGPNHPATHRRAWRSRRAWIFFLTAIALSITLDLATKHLAFAHIADRPVAIERQRVLDAFARDRALEALAAELAELEQSAAPPARIDDLQREVARLQAQPGWGDLLPQHQPVVVVPNVLELTLVLNPGAVFGIGAGARWFFVGFTLAAVAFVTWLFGAWTRPRDTLAHICAGMLIGGGIGNLYDRVLYACVRDFLHPLPNATVPFSSGRPLWPYVSNVADAILILGIIGLLIYSWRKPDPDPSSPHADAPEPDAPPPTEHPDR